MLTQNRLLLKEQSDLGLHCLLIIFIGVPIFIRVLVAQWIKCWPTDLTVPGSSPAGGG